MNDWLLFLSIYKLVFLYRINVLTLAFKKLVSKFLKNNWKDAFSENISEDELDLLMGFFFCKKHNNIIRLKKLENVLNLN